jgi:hypothetical protein
MMNCKAWFAALLRNTDLAITGTSILQHKLRMFLASYGRRAFINYGYRLSLSEIMDYYPAMDGPIICSSAPQRDQETVKPVLHNSIPLKHKGLTQTWREICNALESWEK